MKAINNYEEVQASSGEFERLPSGGYICKITLADDFPLDESTGKGDYLKVEFDIASGDFKDYYIEQYKRYPNFWGGTMYRSYKEKALPMFKHFTNCVEESNAGFTWAWDEKSLVGKFIGLVIGEEEYEKNDGSVGVRMYVKDVKTVEQIKANDFKVPELKKLKVTSKASFVETQAVSDDDLPF